MTCRWIQASPELIRFAQTQWQCQRKLFTSIIRNKWWPWSDADADSVTTHARLCSRAATDYNLFVSKMVIRWKRTKRKTCCCCRRYRLRCLTTDPQLTLILTITTRIVFMWEVWCCICSTKRMQAVHLVGAMGLDMSRVSVSHEHSLVSMVGCFHC